MHARAHICTPTHPPTRTPTQRMRDIEKLAKKSHKEKVAEFNLKLENTPEHYDIPKVSMARGGAACGADECVSHVGRPWITSVYCTYDRIVCPCSLSRPFVFLSFSHSFSLSFPVFPHLTIMNVARRKLHVYFHWPYCAKYDRSTVDIRLPDIMDHAGNVHFARSTSMCGHRMAGSRDNWRRPSFNSGSK